jgi:phosphate transport system substrate-binding protein
MKQLISALILATSLAAALPAISGEVTLKARDGSMSMTGELISFDGQAYTIRSAIGEVSVDAQQVDCIGADCPATLANSDIVVSGSKTVGSVLLPALIEAFALDQGTELVRNAGEPGAVSFTLTPEGASTGSLLTIRMPGSAGGVSDLAAGTADIAILSRPLTPVEAATLPNNTQQILALDALVPVVAASNSQRSISEQDLAAIFSGGIANWADLGGPDAPINMYMREPTSGTREAFDQIVMDAFIAELSD